MAKTIYELWLEFLEQMPEGMSATTLKNLRTAFYAGAHAMSEGCWSLSKLPDEEIDAGIEKLEDEIDDFFDEMNSIIQ